MPKFQIDHVAIAVNDIKPALKLFRDGLGGEFLQGGEEAGGEWRWFQMRYPGGGKIELLEPLKEGFLTRFLERRGEGMHHITFKTDDLKAAVEHVSALGYELVDVDLESQGWKEAFFRPKGAHGTLIQLAETTFEDPEPGKGSRPSNYDELLG